MTDVIPFVKHGYTLNMAIGTGDGFACAACGHWVNEYETEWGDMYALNPHAFGHMHGTEPFHYCPNCGAMILTPNEWAEMYPEDQGKTVGQIARERFA